MPESHDKQRTLLENCPITRVTALVGEPWTLLVLRELFAGSTQFKDFESRLGVARNILSDRLKKLVEAGLLTRVPSAQDGRVVDYRLTGAGKALLPSLIVLAQWALDHLCESDCDTRFIDTSSGELIAPVTLETVTGARARLQDIRLKSVSPMQE